MRSQPNQLDESDRSLPQSGGRVLAKGDADWLSWSYGYCCYGSINVVTQNCRETTAEV